MKLFDKVLIKERNIVGTIVHVMDYPYRGYIVESDIPNIDGEPWKLFTCKEADIEPQFTEKPRE